MGRSDCPAIVDSLWGGGDPASGIEATFEATFIHLRGSDMAATGGKKTRIIDIHGHLNVPGARALLAPAGEGHGGGGRATPPGISDPARTAILHDMAARLADMDVTGVDAMALSPTPQPGFYKADRALAQKVAALQNDHVARVAADNRGRFIGFGIAQMQHPEDAAKELERAVKQLGFKGVFVATHIAEYELGDVRFDPFWAAAQALGAVVFVHPMGFTEPRRLEPWFMTNVVGQPLETTLALAHMIFGGTLERFPRLKVLAVHGGGFLPFYLGRFEQAFRERKECRVHIQKPPKEYVKQMYFDTVVFEPEAIAYLVSLVGVDRVLMGSDRPFDMGDNDPVGLVARVPNLTDAERAKILGGNAETLLNLS
jgi:aminocarboxymuconate-semialdehyde decarboxylase